MKKSTKVKLRAVLDAHGMAQKRHKKILQDCFALVPITVLNNLANYITTQKLGDSYEDHDRHN